MAAALPVQLVARAAPDVELSVNGEAGACQIQSPLIYFLAGRIGAVVEAQSANAHGLRVVQLAHFPGGVTHLRQLLAAIPRGDAADAIDLSALDTLAAAEGAGLLGLRKHMPLLHDAIDERLATVINVSVASAAEVALVAQARGFAAVHTRAVARLVEVLQTRSASASGAGVATASVAAADGPGIGAALTAAFEAARPVAAAASAAVAVADVAAAAGAASAPSVDEDDVGVPPLLQAADGGDDTAAAAAGVAASTDDAPAAAAVPAAETPVAPAVRSALSVTADDAARVAMAIAIGALEAGIPHAAVFADVLAPVIPILSAPARSHAPSTAHSLSDGALAALVRTVVELDLRAALACPQQAAALKALLASAARRTTVHASRAVVATAASTAEQAAGDVAVVVPLDGPAEPASPIAAGATRVAMDDVLQYVRAAVASVAADAPSSSWCSLGLRPTAAGLAPLASAPAAASAVADDSDDPILDAAPALPETAEDAAAPASNAEAACADGKCGGLHTSALQAPAAAASNATAAPLAAYTAALFFVLAGLAYGAAGADSSTTSDAPAPSASARLQTTWSSGVSAADAVVQACGSLSAAADWARVVLEVVRASAPPLTRAAATPAVPVDSQPRASAPPAAPVDEEDEDEVVAPSFAKSVVPTAAAPTCVPPAGQDSALGVATPLRVAASVAGAMLIAAAERGWGLHVSALLRLPPTTAAAAEPAAAPAFSALADSLLATIADEGADDGIVPRVAADAVFACACWFAVSASAGNTGAAGAAAPASSAASASHELFRALAATSTGRGITPALLAAAQQDAFVPIDMLRPFVIHALNTAAAAAAAVPASVVPAVPAPTAAAAAAEPSSVTLAAARAEMMALLQLEMATQRATLRAETAALVDAAVRAERAAASAESTALRAEVETLRARVALLESAAPAMSAAALAALPVAERPAAAIGWLARAAAAGSGEDKLQPIGAQIVLLLRVDDAAAKTAAAAMAAAGGFDLAARLLVLHAPTASPGFLRQLAAILSLVRFRASTTTTVLPTRRAVEAGVLQALLTMGRRFFATVDVVDSACIAIWNVLAPTTGGERADARAILLHAGGPAFLGDALRAYGTSGEEKVAQHILLAVRHAVDTTSDGHFTAAGVPAAAVAALAARPASAPVASAAAHCIRELAATATARPQLLEAGADAALAAALAAHAPTTATHKDLQAARAALNSKLASIEAL